MGLGVGDEKHDATPADHRRRALKNALIQRLVGQKVSLSTNDFHYLVGQLVDFGSDGRLHLRVAGRALTVHRDAVARIHEADPALAEYIK